MTVEEVAAELLCSTTKISRLETAARRPSLRDVRDLCVLYQIDEQTSRELMSLAREAREPGWWTEYPDLNLDPLIGLEQEAVAITCYSINYIPGLLQTRGYAEGIIRTVAPKMDPHVVQQRIEARLRRQKLLEEDDRPRYHVVLDEAVMHRPVGGPVLMATQFDKILEIVRSKRALVQIIPFAAGAYAAADGYFVLLEFEEDSNLWPVVYIEGLADNQYLQHRNDIARYRETINYLCGRALNPADSTELMVEMRKDYACRLKSLSLVSKFTFRKEFPVLSRKMTAGGLDWHVSRTCDNGQCVKVARDGEIVVIGNTNNPEGPFSECTAEEWRHFLVGAKLGDFDGIALRPHIRMMRKGPADVAGPFVSKATWVTCCTGATAESRG